MPICWILGSISTASTWPAPCARAIADVGAAAGADDQHVGERPAGEPLVDLVVERLLAGGWPSVQRLVGDAVDVDLARVRRSV